MATVGIEFQLEIDASDINPFDYQNFEFSLESAPESMTIKTETGIISWTPTKAQIGSHSIKVYVSDGIDQTNITFEVEVSEKEAEAESKETSLIPIIAIVIIVIVLVLILFMWLRKKKKAGADSAEPEKPQKEEEIESATGTSEEVTQEIPPQQTYASAQDLYQDQYSTSTQDPQQDYPNKEPQSTELNFKSPQTTSDYDEDDFEEE